MTDARHTKEVLTVLGLCILWYIVSCSNNVIGKMVLNEFPYPMTMTMVQLLTITVLSKPCFNLLGIRKFVDISWSYYFKLIVPLAFGKFISSVFGHISIWKVSLSYAHTVKATMPLFTVILSRIILQETQTVSVYFSLVPIITGVAIATITEVSFDTMGLVSALVATMGFSIQHIFSKKVLQESGIHHLRLLHILGRLAFFMFLPVWICFDFFTLLHDNALIIHDYRILGLLLADGTLSWLQNIIAFSVLSLVTPLTYAVANASKRIFVIAASLIFIGNKVTFANVFGMFLAILGVFLYNKAKYESRNKNKATILPTYIPKDNKNVAYLNLNGMKNGTSHYSNGLNGFSNNNNTKPYPYGRNNILLGI